jgi:hypothetical protein
MDETGYIAFLKQNKKDAKTIQAYTAAVHGFEVSLAGQGKTLDTATPEDVRNAAGGHLALGMYYEFLGDERRCSAAHEAFSAPNFAAFKVAEFMGIRPEAVKALRVHGVIFARDMLEAGRTPALRASLAQKTGLPVEEILELVKLADQSRIGGHKRIRCRLFHDAGLDTLDKIAACEPEEVRRIQAEFIARTGFEGVPSTPREAANSVRMARYLPRLVEYK